MKFDKNSTDNSSQKTFHQIKFLDYDDFIGTDKKINDKLLAGVNEKIFGQSFFYGIDAIPDYWLGPSLSKNPPFENVSRIFLEVHPEYFDFLVKVVDYYEMDVSSVELTYDFYNPYEHVKLPHELDANRFAINSPFFDKNVSHDTIKTIVALTKGLL